MSERELLEDISRKLDWTAKAIRVLFNQGRANMAKLDDILQDVTDEKTSIDGLSTFIQGLKDQIAALGLNQVDQAKVDAIFTQAEANKAALAAALAANVPPAPPVPPVVPPVTTP